jgi:energy-converting hydrogenase Eha subunit C
VPGLEALGMAGRMLAQVNPFTVWMLTVMAVGAGTINRRSPLPLLIVLNALYLGFLAGIAALQG